MKLLCKSIRINPLFWIVFSYIIFICLAGMILFKNAKTRRNNELYNQLISAFFNSPHTLSQNKDIWQPRANCWIGAYDGAIYFCDTKSQQCVLKRVTSNGTDIISDLGKGNVVTHVYGMNDQWLYYRTYNKKAPDESSVDICCFDLENELEYCVYTANLKEYVPRIDHSMLHGDSGNVYIPLCQKPYYLGSSYLRVNGSQAFEITKWPTDIGSIRDHVFHLLADYTLSTSYHIKDINDDSYVSFLFSGQNKLILCCQYFSKYSSKLEILYGSGTEFSSIFSVECFDSKTAITLSENNLFISILRFQGWAPDMKSYARFENDQMEGTYRINLVSGETEKISDLIFNGLFNMDDTCLYGCTDDGFLYKMSYDGTVEAKIPFRY